MFREIFFKRWAVIGNSLLLIYRLVTIFRDVFSPQIQQKYQLNLLLHRWSWQAWITMVAVVNFLVVFHGAWLAVKKRDKTIVSLEAKLQEIETTKPKIKLREVYSGTVFQTYSETHVGGGGGVSPGANATHPLMFREVANREVPFLNVRFINEPVGSYPSAKAHEVRATIDYYRCSDNEHLLSINGRWSESDQPPLINPLASKSHLLAISFGIGETRGLDIAYRDPQDRQYYAWNNDNYDYQYFRCDRHLLKGKEFKVDIHLLGDWVDERFSFKFNTSEQGFVTEL